MKPWQMMSRFGLQESPGGAGGGTVLSLLHFNGANGSTTFTDETGRSWTRSNTVISTTQSLYGGASGYFNGASNITSNTDTNDQFGTGDFLIEFSCYFNSLGVGIIFETRDTSDTAPKPAIYQNSSTLYYYVNGANVITATSALSGSAWKRIAVSRKSGTTRMFVDGNQVGSSWTDSTNYTNTYFRLGCNRLNSGNFINAYIDEFRVQKGYGIDSNYTPTGPFPNP